jgi:hypothetical protein
MSQIMSISNEPEIRGYGDLIASLPKDSRLIMVIGDREESPWLRSSANPEVKVFCESQFAAEWHEHAADNANAHIWISAAVTLDMPPIDAASITRESSIVLPR